MLLGRAAVAIVILVSTAAAAKAPKKEKKSSLPRVAILELTIEGDAPPELRRQMEKSLAAGFAAAGYDTVARDAVADKIKSNKDLPGCTTTGCLEKIGKLTNAQTFIKGKIEATGQTYAIELVLLSAEAGVVKRLAKSCLPCGVQEANDLASSMASSLFTAPATPEVAKVTVDSGPSGAQVFADEELLGNAPQSVDLAPGEHTFRAVAPGHKPAETKRTVTAGEELSITLTLEQLPPEKVVIGPPPIVEPVPSRFGPWKWAAAGGGAAFLATGLTFIILDGQEVDCQTGQACRHAYDTKTAGILFTAVGVGLGATAIWMFLNDHRGAGPPTTRAAFAPLLWRGGGALVVQGRF